MLLDRMKQAKAEREQQRVDEARQGHIAELQWQTIEAYQALEGAQLTDSDTKVSGVTLKKGEVAYAVIDGAVLIEPRRGPAHWAGGSHGVSFKIAKGMRYRVGQTRGTWVQGEEKPTPIDRGRFVVTNQRALFMGAQRTMEWAWSKLLGFTLEGEAVATFNVSNRQQTTGVLYTREVEARLDAIIAAAIARFHGEDEYAALKDELRDAYQEAYNAWMMAQSDQPVPFPPPG